MPAVALSVGCLKVIETRAGKYNERPAMLLRARKRFGEMKLLLLVYSKQVYVPRAGFPVFSLSFGCGRHRE